MCEIKEKLQAPFDPFDIEFRIGRSGAKGDKVWATALAYVSNRAIQNRLDDVFGVLGWKNEYKEWHGESQLCGISIWDEDKKEWVTKWDGADNTNFESTKGGLSDSMKRAGYQLGIGRYLYKLEETFVNCEKQRTQDWNYATLKDKTPFYWETPKLPNWALPKEFQQKAKPTSPEKARNYTQEANDCKTLPELQTWWTTTMSKEEQKKYDGLKNNRKEEIQKGTK